MNKSIVIRGLCLAVGLLSAAGCEPQELKAPPAKALRMAASPRAAFDIDLPNGCEIIDAPKSLDFTILRIQCNKVDTVGIYLGNAADATFGDKQLILKPDVPGREAVVMKDGKDARLRGYLWRTAYDWPSQIHVWVVPEALDDSKAQAIAASLRPTLPGKMTEKTTSGI